MKKILFIDRDGTLIEEPEDKQVDSLEKLHFVPGVFAALFALKSAGYRFVMVSNQDGLGTASFPTSDFELVQDKMLDIFTSQGITFDDVLICPHQPSAGCTCRKPQIGLVVKYLRDASVDFSRSAVIGDRDSDLQLAEQMQIQAFKITDQSSWSTLTKKLTTSPREAAVSRGTNETQIAIKANLDDPRGVEIGTGIAFFDHMLDQIARHSGIGLQIKAVGDVEVDDHHLVEDTALALGQCIRKALGDKFGINRFGFLLPMDDCQAQIAIDLSDRPFAIFDGDFAAETVGGLSTQMVPHFFRSFADGLRANIQVQTTGANDHHKVESSFKALGRALRTAISKSAISGEMPSTKGVLS